MLVLRRVQRKIAKLALGWFVLYLLSAVVSPMMPGPHMDFLAGSLHGESVHHESQEGRRAHHTLAHEASAAERHEGHHVTTLAAEGDGRDTDETHAVLAVGGGAEASPPTDGGTADHGALHCPLCLVVSAPSSTFLLLLENEQPLARSSKGVPAARISALTGAPLPARGPPAPS